MTGLLGTSPLALIGITLVIMGACAVAVGRAMAENWRGWRSLAAATAGLALADRFLHFALAGDRLIDLPGLVAHFVLLLAIAGAAFQITRAHRMTSQYPWLYERTGLWSYREIGGPTER